MKATIIIVVIVLTISECVPLGYVHLPKFDQDKDMPEKHIDLPYSTGFPETPKDSYLSNKTTIAKITGTESMSKNMV